MSDLIDTTEMYLRTIFELEEEGIVPLRARIAERLSQSGPTVSQTVARMERDGLVVVSGDRHLELTQTGRTLATRVMRKHRIAERLLTDVIGLDWEYVHEEACRWEHVMSERVEKRLVELLDHPTESPYGNPIPGLGELEGGAPDGAGDASSSFLDGVVSLVEASEREGVFLVRRLGEPVQYDHVVMAQLAAAQVRPGSAVALERRAPARRGAEGSVVVRADGAEVGLELADSVASHVFVAPRA
ncbi:metal-dependent transcriptional regulator [uncultured Pseudokineococcus sp.]|uniref:metal-dependent transcriptional regulator n=1 Tax=uncultured Pseudokineococcus sp. TaxID=1642928 RepID=UPI002623293F|nr:metal-dependent transcriptional regulator [uncultured Pseudokineococcus sp.]